MSVTVQLVTGQLAKVHADDCTQRPDSRLQF